jgi:pyridoxamine 5'-phosphate oxidase
LGIIYKFLSRPAKGSRQVDLDTLRREYLQGGLHREDLHGDPLQQFDIWLQQACKAELQDPTAMTIATVNSSGQPSQRIVLLKKLDEKGFVFYTNLGSRKAQELADNPKVSLHFAWLPLDRQVIIRGEAQRISAAQALKYFISRPKESQLAAWASKQSNRISSRQLLDQQFAQMKEKFSQGEIPLPSFWGGYCVKPETIEFWQGGANRLHDRFLYSRGENRHWSIERLAP